jgi:hypothetical protein
LARGGCQCKGGVNLCVGGESSPAHSATLTGQSNHFTLPTSQARIFAIRGVFLSPRESSMVRCRMSEVPLIQGGTTALHHCSQGIRSTPRIAVETRAFMQYGGKIPWPDWCQETLQLSTVAEYRAASRADATEMLHCCTAGWTIKARQPLPFDASDASVLSSLRRPEKRSCRGKRVAPLALCYQPQINPALTAPNTYS